MSEQDLPYVGAIGRQLVPDGDTETLRARLEEVLEIHSMEWVAKAIETRSFGEVEGRYTLTHPQGNVSRVLRLTNNDAAKVVRDFGKDGA